jgi:hypothetical protein
VLYYGWVIPAAVTVAALVAVYWRFVFALPALTRTRLLVAAALFLAGEMGMEMVGGWVIDREGVTLAYALMTSVEEFLAMPGVVVAIGALLGYARSAVGEVSVTVDATDWQRRPAGNAVLVAPTRPEASGGVPPRTTAA